MAFTTQDIHRVLLVDSNGDPLIVAGQDLATAAKQDTQITSLASILAKIIAAPSTEAKQDTIITLLTALGANTDTIEALLAGNLISVGNIAHDSPDSGNPVKIGGKASSAAPTSVTSGDRVEAWYSLKGRSVASILNAAANDTATIYTANDFGDNAGILGVGLFQYNGTTGERARGQSKETLLASAARTVATSANLTLTNNCAILLVVDVTARAVATTLTPSLVMGQTGFVANKTIWTAAAAINSASGTFMYVFWPMPTIASPTGFTEVINTPLFRELQVTITPNDANSVTYSVVAYTALLG